MIGTTATCLLDAANGELVLRICGGARDGQIVRLRSNKCTIGSGPQCTLRLRARHVQPVHCLIIRGTTSTVIRRWATDTRLNGRDFTDAKLALGDRLSIGPIELEVLHTSWFSTDSSAEADLLSAIAQQEKPDPSYGSPRFNSAGVNEQDGGLVEYHRQLDQARAALEAQEQALSDQRRQLDAERAKFEREVKLRAEELDAREAELEARSEALPLRQRPSRAEQPPGGSQERRSAEHHRQPQPRFRQPTDEPPVDTTGVFRRMENVSLAGEDERETLAAAPRPDTSDMIRDSRPVPEPACQDDESIDEYMSRLLDRVRSTTDGLCQSRPAPQSPPPAPPRSACRPAEPSKETPPASASPAPEEPADDFLRARTPEQISDLHAMRALANLSACNAIERYTQRTLIHDRSSRLMMAIVGLVAGGSLIWIWWSRLTSELTLSAGLISLVVALLWSVQYVVLTGRVIVNRSRRQQRESCESGREADGRPEAADGSPEEADAGQERPGVGAGPASDERP